MSSYCDVNAPIEDWVGWFETKLSHLGVLKQSELADIFAISSHEDLLKIEEAQVIAYGKIIGVNSFEDACHKLDINVPIYSDKLSSGQIAPSKLQIIKKALNGDWESVWDPFDQIILRPPEFTSIFWENPFSFPPEEITNSSIMFDLYIDDSLRFKSKDMLNFVVKKFKTLFIQYWGLMKDLEMSK